MKLLNEANLVYFSTCSSHTTKEGWLYKRGDVNKSFQKRWFVLKGNLLFYFDKPGDKDPNGVIILEGYTVELDGSSPDGLTFLISFKGASSSSRKYVLQAESHTVMEQWMKVITCAGYDYMKLMVAELKAQLDSLTAQELSEELSECKTRADSLDPFDMQPLNTALASSAESTATHGSDSSPFSTDQKDSSSEHYQKTRLNPFDRDYAKGATNLDPFGQVPFTAQADLAFPRDSLTVPNAPTRKKHKPSPKGERKAGNSSPKLTKKQEEPQGKAQFYAGGVLHDDSRLRKSSKFLDLHIKYGEMIRYLIKPTRNSSPQPKAAEKTASLIDF